MNFSLDRSRIGNKVVKPATSIKAGGVDKQPNSCNPCHYHKNDPADKLQLVMDRMKKEY